MSPAFYVFAIASLTYATYLAGAILAGRYREPHDPKSEPAPVGDRPRRRIFDYERDA
jgi:uncharacterized protein (DUF1810 family)